MPLAGLALEKPDGTVGNDRLEGVYRFLADYGHEVFPSTTSPEVLRWLRSVPARVIGTVMAVQAAKQATELLSV